MDNKNNTGINNSGNWNSGDWNSGNWNSGYRNSGYRNSGDWNSGNWNSGDWNSGYWNSGNWNSGYWNSGNCNSGNWNSGDWNSGDWNSGYCNSKTPKKIRVFDKKCSRADWDNAQKPQWLFNIYLTKWVDIEDMSDQEKIDNPTYQTTRGYLKKFEYQEAAKIAWDATTEEDRLLTFKLPNFKKKKFFKIFGIDVSNYFKKDNSNVE